MKKTIIKQYKYYFLALAIVAIVAGLFNISVNYKIKEIIDNVASGKNLSKLIALFILYKLLHHGMFFISRLLDIKYKPKIMGDSLVAIYSKTMNHSLHWFDSHLSAEISSKIVDFQNSLTQLITTSFRALHILAAIIIGIIFLFFVNIKSGLVVIAFVLSYAPLLTFLLKKQLKLQQHYVDAKQETVGIINDSIANIFCIKVIGNLATEFKLKLIPSIKKLQDWDRITRKFDAYFVDNSDTILVTTMCAVQIYLLVHLFRTGEISAGSFAFIAMITLQIHSDLDTLLEHILFTINPAIASITSSYRFVSTMSDTRDSDHAITVDRLTGKIVFDEVSFTYEGCNKAALSRLALHIPAGQRIGIVGASGAGKTTLIKCLMRYFDISSGKITIDNHNINNITQESLRANISIIPQDITMFHRTIMDNLLLAKQEASLDEIVAACKKAKIHDDILAMPNGYETIVGERGVKLSGGQRQRVAIARAILKNAPILILDEATSALDSKTEQLIQASLGEVLDETMATTIVIAHRLSTIAHLDRILVMNQGAICGDGTHEQLLLDNQNYKNLWNAQVGGFFE